MVFIQLAGFMLFNGNKLLSCCQLQETSEMLLLFVFFLVTFTAQNSIMQITNRPTRKTLRNIDAAFQKCQKIKNPEKNTFNFRKEMQT